jgi:hypothetical protein
LKVKTKRKLSKKKVAVGAKSSRMEEEIDHSQSKQDFANSVGTVSKVKPQSFRKIRVGELEIYG